MNGITVCERSNPSMKCGFVFKSVEFELAGFKLGLVCLLGGVQ